MEQTRLQKIIAQKAEQIRVAIEEAIDDGAEIRKSNSYSQSFKTCYIDGLYLQKCTYDDTLSVILDFRSGKIAKVFEPSNDELKKLIEQKRAEMAAIEKQINEIRNNETDHN